MPTAEILETVASLTFGGIAGVIATALLTYAMEQRGRRMEAALEFARWAMAIHLRLADLLSNMQLVNSKEYAADEARINRCFREIEACLDFVTTAINFTDVDTRLRLAYGNRSIETQQLVDYCQAVHDSLERVIHQWKQEPESTTREFMRALNEQLLPKRERLKSRLIARSTLRNVMFYKG